MGFETARRGLAVNQKGLDIVGHNLSNVYTEGYTRQRVDVYSVGTNIGRNRYAGPKSDYAGQGVGMGGVSQTRDPFLDKRFRDEYADVGYYDTYSAILQDIEFAVGDPEFQTETGIKNAIKNISNSLQEFMMNADSKVHANVVATEFKNLTLTLHQLEAKLNNVAVQQKGDLGIGVDDVNDILAKIGGMNKAISDDVSARADDGEYYGPNELFDRRNVLLDKLSQYANIDVTTNPDGTVDVDMAGRNVVKGEKYEKINYRENSDGTVLISWNSDGSRFTAPNGALQAATDLINGRGMYAQDGNESMHNGVPYYKDKLNTFANTLMQTFNNLIPEIDENGAPIAGKFKKLLGSRDVLPDGSVQVRTAGTATAGSISLSDEWTADSGYVIYKAGSLDSESGASKMYTALTKNKQNFYHAGVLQQMTFNDFVEDYANDLASETQFNSGRYDATVSVTQDTLDRRDAVSAVAPDEETTNMMLYNKSFQAISRLMTTLDEALDVLINRTGMVGR